VCKQMTLANPVDHAPALRIFRLYEPTASLPCFPGQKHCDMSTETHCIHSEQH